MLAACDELFTDTAEELVRVMRQIRAGEFTDVKATAALRDLRAAFQLAMEERGKVDKLRKHVAGVVGTGELDLHAARVEIGRRLACLRDAAAG